MRASLQQIGLGLRYLKMIRSHTSTPASPEPLGMPSGNPEAPKLLSVFSSGLRICERSNGFESIHPTRPSSFGFPFITLRRSRSSTL